MSLNIESWKPFRIGEVFNIFNGKGVTQEEIEANPGDFPTVQSGDENNGIIGYMDLEYAKSVGYTYTTEPCLTVARSGTAGSIHFLKNGCIVGDSAKILQTKDKVTETCYMFLATILKALRYKYSYGRKVTEGKYLEEVIKLPVNSCGEPDWNYMEQYIKSLHYKQLTTQIVQSDKKRLDAEKWKTFYLHRIMNVQMGNGVDAILTTSDNPQYNYVSRNSNGNGVVAYIDKIEDETPFPAGAMSLALGGEYLGSCFVQNKPFYTAQNVAVLQEIVPMSVYTKLFIATMIRNECKVKYQAFGRELNSHIRKDFTFKLPVLTQNNSPVIDESYMFSDEGYIPDWEWMENYIKTLPYSDKLS